MFGAIFYVYKKEVQKMNDLIELKLITREDAECLHKLQIEAFMPLYEKYQDDATSPAKESLETITKKIVDDNSNFYYYVLSKYDSNINIERVIDAFASDEVNPIIIAGFIKEGFGNNKKLFDYIKRVYMAVENREGENSYWMRSIMFSKWWLPLMLIYVKDGKNYSSFYDSNHFHDFFKSMRIEPEQEQEQLVEQVAEEDDIFW